MNTYYGDPWITPAGVSYPNHTQPLVSTRVSARDIPTEDLIFELIGRGFAVAMMPPEELLEVVNK